MGEVRAYNLTLKVSVDPSENRIKLNKVTIYL